MKMERATAHLLFGNDDFVAIALQHAHGRFVDVGKKIRRDTTREERDPFSWFTDGIEMLRQRTGLGHHRQERGALAECG